MSVLFQYSKLDELISEYSDSIKKVTADEDDPLSETCTKKDVEKYVEFIDKFFKLPPLSKTCE